MVETTAIAAPADLAGQLRALKLSGILTTLEQRLLEAEQSQMSLSELLTMLLSDELEARRNRKLARLAKHAHLDAGQTLEAFDFTFAAGAPRALIRDLATCRFIQRAENVFFLGPTGTGKTHLAQALSHAACRRFLSVEFYKFSGLLEALLKADLTGATGRLLKDLSRCDLLVIDEFAMRKLDTRSAEWIYTIIDNRYGSGSTILTSNRSLDDWMAVFPDKVTANAVMDRLAHNAHQIVLKGESYRKKKGLKDNALNTKTLAG
jgi:DNA replication protein DnaC